jgi:hypothetical protein
MNGFVSPELRIITASKVYSSNTSGVIFVELGVGWGEEVGGGSGVGENDPSVVDGVVTGKLTAIKVTDKMVSSTSTRTGLLFNQEIPFFSTHFPPFFWVR